MLLTEVFYLLYGNLRDLFAIKLCCGNRSGLVRIKINTSSLILKYGSVIFFCIFIGIALQCIPIIQCQIIRGILLLFQCFPTVSSVDIIQDNAKRSTVRNNMMNIKEQIISVTGSVNFKPEKLFVKQHIGPDQRFPVHLIQDLRFIAQLIVPFLKNFSVLIHKQTSLQIRMCLYRAVNSRCKPIQIYFFIQFQKVGNVVNGGSHICSTFNEDSLLRIGKRITVPYLSLCCFSCTLNKAL